MSGRDDLCISTLDCGVSVGIWGMTTIDSERFGTAHCLFIWAVEENLREQCFLE
jgi:hypothetical protein